MYGDIKCKDTTYGDETYWDITLGVYRHQIVKKLPIPAKTFCKSFFAS
jgi:hypothetical protein